MTTCYHVNTTPKYISIGPEKDSHRYYSLFININHITHHHYVIKNWIISIYNHAQTLSFNNEVQVLSSNSESSESSSNRDNDNVDNIDSPLPNNQVNKKNENQEHCDCIKLN